MSVNINTETSNVVVNNSDRTIIVNDNTRSTSINVNQPITNVISVNVPGPQGPVGPLNTGSFVQGGNSFGATGILGTNDNQSLGIETNGSIRMFVSSSGNIGIGTTSSLARFQVRGLGTTSASISLRVENSVGFPSFTILDNSSASFSGNLTVTGSVNNLPILGGSNIALGFASLSFVGTGVNNLALGNEALFRNTRGTRNLGIGFFSGRQNTGANDNIAIGFEALYSNNGTSRNIAIGNYALRNHNPLLFGTNIAIGHEALFTNTSGFGNIALGERALYANTSGYGNIAIASLANNTTGYANVAIGGLFFNTTGYYNTAMGPGSLQNNTTGYYNTAIGGGVLGGALSNNTTGNNNTALGYNTGQGIETGRANTIIGANVTGLTSSLSNTIILADGDGNQKFIIDSSSFATLSGSLNVTNGITGSIFIPVSGTFVLPLTSTVGPNIPTGSAYWSGSFLFIWDGSRYRSSSFS